MKPEKAKNYLEQRGLATHLVVAAQRPSAGAGREGDLGVQDEHGEVGEVSQDTNSVRCGDLRARYLAAADGLHSPIRASLGLAVASRGRRRWGIRRHIQISPWSDNVEVYWSVDAEAYVTPVADDCLLLGTDGLTNYIFDDDLRQVSDEPVVLFEDPANFGGLVTGHQVDAPTLHRYLSGLSARP